MTFRLLFLSAAPFACFILGYFFCSWYLGNATYPTPDLVGLSVHQALLDTSKMHINLHVIAQKEHKALLPGTIISQKPAPNRLIKQHQSILITTSKKPETLKAPHAAQMSRAMLEEWSKNNNIKLKCYDIASQLPDGYFIGQYPDVNTPILNQTLIAYYAQQQYGLFLMPNFYHQKLKDVIQLLEQYNLSYNVFYQNELIVDFDIENMHIITQKPTASSLIDIQKHPTIQLEVEYTH